jgi:hypothetical protein
VKQHLQPLPVLKPNEAMVDEAVARAATTGGRPIGLVASFAPTLASMPAEFPSNVALRTAFADGALDALARGDTTAHDEAAARTAQSLADAGCGLIALAQFSLARAAPLVALRTGLPVLTTVDSAVRRLREQLGAN